MTDTTQPLSKASHYTLLDEQSADELERLRYENEKLKKINNVLMRRVEMGWGNHSSAYQSFEDAALLADKVKERTLKLQQTLHRLEESNQQLELAKHEAEHNRFELQLTNQRLSDAIESISESFVLFNADRKMVMVNSRCARFWERHNIHFEIGKTTFQEITSASLPLVDRASKAQKKVSTEPEPITQTIFKLKDGTWIQMSERKTTDNGLVVVYTDITTIMNMEEMRHEKALAEQAQLLKATLENMSQGVALVNENLQLESWNHRFLELAKIDEDIIFRGADFIELLKDSELQGSCIELIDKNSESFDGLCEKEKILNSGRVLLMRMHRISSGGYLSTYTDITERSMHQRALQESEQRIRLITDAMPALISYVNKDMCYEFVNREFEKWFHRSRTEIINHHLRDVLGDDAFSNLHIYIERAMLGQSVNFELEQQADNGSTRISNKTFIPHFDQDRQVIGFFALEQDVTEQRRTARALKHAYDYIEQRVNQRTKKISEINEQLRKEIEDRQLAEISLLEAKREADSANESKSKFLAATSHDLLQPMNSARLFAGALSDLTLDAEAHKLISSLSYSLENLESLISALVDISKLEAGLIEPVYDEFIIGDLLENIANEFRPQVLEQGLHFSFQSASRVVYSDTYLLARILRNFLTNAIRYTPSGTILLGCRRRAKGIEVYVCDSGIGIPEDKLTEIFKEFNRIDPKQRRDDKGLGLGLAIVDKLASVMGHKIDVRSELGKGSCFSVLVPYGNQDAQVVKQTSPQPIDQFNSNLQGANILIIDNDLEICAGMDELLSGWGCMVTSVSTIAELERENWLKHLNPDLIVTDYHLDNDDTGFDALEITERELGDQVPVIMITANHTNELRQVVRSRGYSLLNKPVKTQKMKMALSNLLARTKQNSDS